jgi:hypothetical protein
LAREVHLQPDDGRISSMHRKPEQPPAGLMRRKVTTILVLADLVDSTGVYRDLCHSLIGTFINILIVVLHSLHGTTEFDVDMGIIPLQ